MTQLLPVWQKYNETTLVRPRNEWIMEQKTNMTGRHKWFYNKDGEPISHHGIVSSAEMSWLTD